MLSFQILLFPFSIKSREIDLEREKTGHRSWRWCMNSRYSTNVSSLLWTNRFTFWFVFYMLSPLLGHSISICRYGSITYMPNTQQQSRLGNRKLNERWTSILSIRDSPWLCMPIWFYGGLCYVWQTNSNKKNKRDSGWPFVVNGRLIFIIWIANCMCLAFDTHVSEEEKKHLLP